MKITINQKSYNKGILQNIQLSNINKIKIKNKYIKVYLHVFNSFTPFLLLIYFKKIK